MTDAFERALGEAVSNKSEEGTGADILRRRVLPRRQDEASLCLLVLLLLDSKGDLPGPGEEKEFAWPAFSVTLCINEGPTGDEDAGRVFSGTARIGTPLEKGGGAVAWTWNAPGKRQGSQEFLLMDESAVTVTFSDGTKKTRAFADMPRHTRDYVALRTIAALRERNDEAAMAVARHALSLAAPWEEAQTSMPGDWNWTILAPYLLAACVLDDAAATEKREQLAAFLDSLAIPPAMRELAWRHVRQAMLASLGGGTPDWFLLARWVERAKRYTPGIILWPVQNAYARQRSDEPGKRELGVALGFEGQRPAGG